MEFFLRREWFRSIIILLVGVIVVACAIIVVHWQNEIKSAQTQAKTDQLARDIASYSADKNLERRYAHPVHSQAGPNSIVVEEPLDLGGFRTSEISYTVSHDATQVSVYIPVPDNVFHQALRELAQQGTVVGAKNILLSEKAAAELVDLHEVYAHIFALTHGTNPFAIDYRLGERG